MNFFLNFFLIFVTLPSLIFTVELVPNSCFNLNSLDIFPKDIYSSSASTAAFLGTRIPHNTKFNHKDIFRINKKPIKNLRRVGKSRRKAFSLDIIDSDFTTTFNSQTDMDNNFGGDERIKSLATLPLLAYLKKDNFQSEWKFKTQKITVYQDNNLRLTNLMIEPLNSHEFTFTNYARVKMATKSKIDQVQEDLFLQDPILYDLFSKRHSNQLEEFEYTKILIDYLKLNIPKNHLITVNAVTNQPEAIRLSGALTWNLNKLLPPSDIDTNGLPEIFKDFNFENQRIQYFIYDFQIDPKKPIVKHVWLNQNLWSDILPQELKEESLNQAETYLLNLQTKSSESLSSLEKFIAAIAFLDYRKPLRVMNALPRILIAFATYTWMGGNLKKSETTDQDYVCFDWNPLENVQSKNINPFEKELIEDITDLKFFHTNYKEQAQLFKDWDPLKLKNNEQQIYDLFMKEIPKDVKDAKDAKEAKKDTLTKN